VKLAPKPGRLTVRADPSEIVLRVNGRAVRPEEITSGEIQLPAGEFLELEASARGYKSATRSVTLSPNGAQSWDVALDKLRGAEEGQPWTVPELNLEMAYIRPGTFTMGDGTDAHQVTLTKSFWLGKTEVTQGQYEALMESNPSNFKNDGRDTPVELVSWEDAIQFCRKLTDRERQAGRLPEGFGYTLPTEAQWEYACRSGTTEDYAGNLDAMAWYNQNSGNTTHPVAQKQANAWGLHDMHGNVWEWCRDWYGNYPGGSATDPTGPFSGSLRVYRGGGWCGDAGDCRSAVRRWDVPGDRRNGLGFRLALAPQTNTEASQALNQNAKAAVISAPQSDEELLKAAVPNIRPSGVFILGGKPWLLFSGRKLKVGDDIEVTLNGAVYRLAIVEITTTGFRVRLNSAEISIPIKPGRTP
jgi:formylglycine-generating enzyme required for sulfatase activity